MMKYLCLIVVLQLVCACNIVHMQERLLKRSIRQNGLVQKRIDIGNNRIAYWEGGQGPTLVLLHGFGADGTWGWSEQIPALAKYFHLVVPDLLWFGGSSSTDLDFTVEHQVVALRQLLKHMNVTHYDMAGISYGGVMALRLMAETPDEVNRAVIIASPGPIYTQSDYVAMLDHFQVKSASEIVLPTTRSGLDRLMNIAYRNPPYVPNILKQTVINYVKDRSGRERTALLDELVSSLESLKSKIKRIPERVLLIWGSDDPLFPLELGIRFKNYLGDKAQLRVIDGAKHAVNIEFPVEFNQAMLEFLLPPKD